MHYNSRDFLPNFGPIVEVETEEISLPDFSKRDPSFEPVSWCPRCGNPSRDIITYTVPCGLCGYPGLKEEDR